MPSTACWASRDEPDRCRKRAERKRLGGVRYGTANQGQHVVQTGRAGARGEEHHGVRNTGCLLGSLVIPGAFIFGKIEGYYCPKCGAKVRPAWTVSEVDRVDTNCQSDATPESEKDEAYWAEYVARLRRKVRALAAPPQGTVDYARRPGASASSTPDR